MQISFKNDIAALTKDLQAIKQSAVPKATVQALNRTITGSRTDAKKELSRITSIKQSTIVPPADSGKTSMLSIKKASRKIQQAHISARKGYALNLIEFVSPSQRKPNYFNKRTRLKSGRVKYRAKGVKARAWGKRTTYDGTFIGTGKYGIAVYKRTSARKDRLTRIHGPSIRQEFNNKTFQAKLKSQASVRFEKNMIAAVRNQIRLATKNKVQPR
ncbi:MAG: phage tail protein [Thalassotalea sp.]|nr:phage tail protein [Thalassotalea sp.]